MMYILDEAEYRELLALGRSRQENRVEQLQKLCTRAANEIPIKFWGRDEATAWGCILTVEHEWYCDECPAKVVCPHDGKRWSK